MKYDFSAIESKWQKRWEEAHIFEAQDASDKPKFYGLVEFPYPSGVGMHVGHIKAYSGLEVVSRKRRMQGYNVLFPIGFDAFGLPTENSAIKTGIHPRELTDRNIRKFTQQLKRVGFSFDWTRVIDTTEEDYYRWTQYIFLKMFEKGLAFRSTALVNYCPHCKVVLSNEDSQGGKCDICHSDIIQKSKDVLVSAHHRLRRQTAGGTPGCGLPAQHPPAADQLDRKIPRCIRQFRRDRHR